MAFSLSYFGQQKTFVRFSNEEIRRTLHTSFSDQDLRGSLPINELEDLVLAKTPRYPTFYIYGLNPTDLLNENNLRRWRKLCDKLNEDYIRDCIRKWGILQYYKVGNTICPELNSDASRKHTYHLSKTHTVLPHVFEICPRNTVYFSYLLFVSLLCLAGLSVQKQWLLSIISLIQPFIGGIFQATVQSAGGRVYIVFFIFIILMWGLFFSRRLNRFFSYQRRLVRTFLNSPSKMTAASFVLSVISSTQPQVQLLTLLAFSWALFLRFSGIDDYDPEFSMCRRLSSRLIEYMLYYLFSTQSTICRIDILIPLAFLVSACRSNEVFRIWQLRQDSLSNFHDHELAWDRMRKFQDMAMAPLLDSARTKIAYWPGTIDKLTKSYPAVDNLDALQLASTAVGTNYNDRFDAIKELMLTEGMYGWRRKPNNQYGFLWADGSGVVMASVMAVVAQLVAISVQQVDLHPAEHSSSTGNRAAALMWNIQLCFVSIGLFLYLLIQCIPGCLVVLDMVMKQNQDASMNDWRKWFKHVCGFCRELLVKGHPGPDHTSEKSRVKAEESWWQVMIRGTEGLELVPHVILYAIIRVLAMAIFLDPLNYLNAATRSVLGLSIPTERMLNRMSLIFANISTYRDAIRAKSAIISAEVLLNTRMVITVNNISCCTSTNVINTPTFQYIKPLPLEILIDDLHIGLEGDTNKSSATAHKIKDERTRRQAINQGLFSSVLEELDSIKNNSNNTKADTICNQYAKPILDLLSQIYFNRENVANFATTTRKEYDENAKEVVKMLKEFAVQSRWDKVKNNWIQNAIMNEIDMQIMRIQLQLSMLLFNLNEPSVVGPSMSGRILKEWFEARRSHVKGIGFCDFIKDVQDP